MYVQGVSTRKVDELLQALGLTGIGKRAVSRLCRELDPIAEQFRQRPLAAADSYVRLDALYLNVRRNYRIVSQAVVIAVGVRETGDHEGAVDETLHQVELAPRFQILGQCLQDPFERAQAGPPLDAAMAGSGPAGIGRAGRAIAPPCAGSRGCRSAPRGYRARAGLGHPLGVASGR